MMFPAAVCCMEPRSPATGMTPRVSCHFSTGSFSEKVEAGVLMANILVVEDERLIARLLKETLQIEGYQVVTVLHGEDAVQFTLRETPHLVLLDMKLPDIDGYEVVRQLRAHPKSMHIPIIVLSALDDTAFKVRAFEMGVDDYVTKP